MFVYVCLYVIWEWLHVGGYELHVGMGLNLGSLEEQWVVLTTEPAFQSLTNF